MNSCCLWLQSKGGPEPQNISALSSSGSTGPQIIKPTPLKLPGGRFRCQTQFGCFHSLRESSVAHSLRLSSVSKGPQTHDRKVASVIAKRSSGRFFFLQSKLSALTFIQCPCCPLVTAVACKSSWSFCQKRRWQVTPDNTYTLDPTKLEWANYAVQT